MELEEVNKNKMSIYDFAESGDLDGVNQSIKNGEDIESRGFFGTPLITASRGGHESIVNTLIFHDADVKYPKFLG